MKVLLVSQTYGQKNGPGVFTAALARGLAAAGDEVVVIAPAGSLRSAVRADDRVVVAEVRACSLAPWFPDVRIPLAPARLVRSVIARAKPDIVHLQDHFPLARRAARACAPAGPPLVATNHFVPENILPHVPVMPRSRRGRGAIERLLWRQVATVFGRARVVVSPTETAAARLRPHLGSVPMRAISCGVDLDRFGAFAGTGDDRRPREGRRAVRRALGLCADDLLFLYVGRLDVEKNVDMLVWATAATRCARIKLLVVGAGRQAAALRRLAQRLGLEQRVLFTGVVAHAALPRLLRGGDFFAIAGDVELQSIATLEAMAAGLPVVAAAGGALPELVEDGVNGALFPPGDAAGAAAAMRALVAAPHRWQAMSRASVERARGHGFDRTVAAYRALYAAVIASDLERSA